MGKSRRGDREISREQKLAHENTSLKKQVASLRKQLARLDLDRHHTVKEIIEEHCQESQVQPPQVLLEQLKKEWACHECRIGHLEITLYNRINDTYYYRSCVNCGHRTKSKKYDPDSVKGILRKN